MKIEYDQDKQATTLRERGLDFSDAGEVFAGPTMTGKDTRVDYGESRFITFGHLSGKLIVLVWTPRGAARRIISTRYANDREKSKYAKFLG